MARSRLQWFLSCSLLLCGLLEVLVMATPPHRVDTFTNYGPGTDCRVGGRVIPNGEVFTDPSLSRCLLHQCYFGSSFIFSEGCEDSRGGCHDVGEQWDENCISYICTKTPIGGYNYYQPILQRARCRDADGHCHDQGQVFSYVLRGRRHNTCRCSITNDRILYRKGPSKCKTDGAEGDENGVLN